MLHHRSLLAVLSLLLFALGCSGNISRPKSGLGTDYVGASNGEANGSEGDNGESNGDYSGATDGGSGGGNDGPESGTTGGKPPAPVGEVNYPCPAAEPKGVIHYVCDCGQGAAEGCVAGNDTNNGATPDTPWRTYEKARTTFATMAPGETIAFCRGGSFTVGSANRWVNARCQADNRCIVRDYQPKWGAESKGAPIINAGNNERIFSLDNASAPMHEEGYVFANLSLRGTGKGLGFFFYNDVDDVLVCSNSFDRLGIGVQMEGSQPGSGDTRQARVVVRGNRFTNSEGFGYLGGCDECVVEDNYFANNGQTAVFDHNLYLHNGGNGGKPFMNMRVVGNELYRSTFIDGKCQGISLVVHGLYDNLLIEDNYLHEDEGATTGNCWGIIVTAADTDAEGFRNVSIRGNRLENLGGVFIGVNSCVDCIIENNIMINTDPNVDFFGVRAPAQSRGPEDLTNTNLAVRNNSMYFAAGLGVGISVGTEGNKHVVASNAIHFAGTKEFACLELDMSANAYSGVDNNLCYFPNASARWENKAGNLAAWRSLSNLDMSSAVKDPGFKSLTAPFDLTSASANGAMVGQGHAAWSSPLTFEGTARSAPPDIGAYQR